MSKPVTIIPRPYIAKPTYLFDNLIVGDMEYRLWTSSLETLRYAS